LRRSKIIKELRKFSFTEHQHPNYSADNDLVLIRDTKKSTSLHTYINMGLRAQLFCISTPFCFLLLHYSYAVFLGPFVTDLTLWKVMLRKRVKEIENERNGMVKLSQEATKGEVT